MFQFARFAFYIYEFNIKCRKRRVSPFGNPRIKVYSQLPRAYRSVSRPSSPLGAKASTKCTFIAWNIICTETNLHMIIKFSVWWLVKLFQTALNMSLDWWRWTGSNRWPPACKAGALPTELHPLKPVRLSPFYFRSPPKLQCTHIWSNAFGWWAWVDLNYRPHAYQACALTKLSYGPNNTHAPPIVVIVHIENSR